MTIFANAPCGGRRILASATLAVLAAGLTVVPALAGKAPKAASPEAADRTLGMALLGARIDAGGDLTRSAGVVRAQRNGEGKYGVVFVRDVSTCFTAVTPVLTGSAGYFVLPGSEAISVSMRSATTGEFTDQAFDVIVFCPR